MAIETIGVRVVVEGAEKAVSDLNRVNKAAGSLGGAAAATASPLGILAGALANVGQIAAGIISAQLFTNLVEGLKSVAQEALFGAGRVEELEIILELLGTRAGYGTAQLYKWRDAVVDAGIRTDVATKLLAQFIRYQIDAAQAVELANVAQDAAVFAQQDSTEALDGLLHGILTQRSIVLRTYGVQVDFNRAYAEYGDLIGKAADELDANERVQAALNAVLQQGVSITGSYEAAMGTWSKMWRTLTGRLIPEMIWQLGGPFQQAMGSVVFAIADFVEGLTAAVSEGGSLRPILDGLASAAMRLLAPLIAIVRVISSYLGAANAAKAVTSDWDMKMADMRRPTEKVTEVIAQLGDQWAKEGKKIADVTRDLTKSITRMWDDHGRQLAKSIFDFNLSRLRDELDWQKRRERELGEHNRKMADMYAELNELRTGKRRQEIKAQMQDEQKNYGAQRAQFEQLLGEAQSDEERLRIQGWLDALQAEHQGQQDVLQEEMTAIDAEQALLEKRIAMEERAFEQRRDLEAEDRRVRMAREDEDFARRTTRDEEEVRRREELQREESRERIAIIQEQIADEKAAKLASYQEQQAMLTQSVGDQQGILKGFTDDQETLVGEWTKTFEGFIPTIRDELIPTLNDMLGAWSVFSTEMWPILKPILEFLGRLILPVINAEMDKLTRMMAQAAIVIWANEVALKGFNRVTAYMAEVLRDAWEEAQKIAGRFYEVGAGIVQGIIDGVNGMWQHIINRVRDLAEAIIYEIKLRLGMGSPSKVFIGMGQEISRSLAEGIRSMGDLPALQMGQVTLGTLAAVPASTTSVSNQYNLNMTSLAPTSTVAADFHLMQVMAKG